MGESRIWEIRAYVYRHFAETARAPRPEEVSAQFELTHEEASAAYEELHRRHALFLRPGAHEILMANPFSAVETPFRVQAAGRTYFANCAWDSLGIPAALQADAQIEAACAQSGEPIRLRVTDGQVYGPGALVHFLTPFRAWYDDLVFT